MAKKKTSSAKPEEPKQEAKPEELKKESKPEEARQAKIISSKEAYLDREKIESDLKALKGDNLAIVLNFMNNEPLTAWIAGGCEVALFYVYQRDGKYVLDNDNPVAVHSTVTGINSHFGLLNLIDLSQMTKGALSK